jgi:hypothetical protein
VQSYHPARTLALELRDIGGNAPLVAKVFSFAESRLTWRLVRRRFSFCPKYSSGITEEVWKWQNMTKIPAVLRCGE